MSLGDADKTPNPEIVPTPADFARRLKHVEAEIRDLKRDFGHHKSVDFDDLEDRVDRHDAQFDDTRRLIVSIQTTNGLTLQSIDRSLASMVVMIQELRKPTATEVTAVTAVPHE